MSVGSLLVLARVAGASRPPLTQLYRDGWPGRLHRVGQLAFSATQWCLHRSGAMVVAGQGVPAAKGAVRVQSRLGLRDWFAGAYVMRGAEVSTLASNLRLDADPVPELYLADADVLVVMGRRSGVPVVLHVASDPDRLGRYWRCADRARSVLAPLGLGHLVPKVLEQRPTLDLHLLAQERLIGRTVRPTDLSADELERHVQAALQPLQTIAMAAKPAPEGADDAILTHELNLLEVHRELAAWVRSPLRSLRNWPGRRGQPAVLAHGDYWFSNILFAATMPPRVSGLLDWERSRADACAGFDALHLVMFSFAGWRGCTPMQVLCMLWDDLCEPVLERLLGHAAQAMHLSTEDLRHVALAIWLLHLSRHATGFAAWDAPRRADWLEEPASSVRSWLSRASAV